MISHPRERYIQEMYIQEKGQPKSSVGCILNILDVQKAIWLYCKTLDVSFA